MPPSCKEESPRADTCLSAERPGDSNTEVYNLHFEITVNNITKRRYSNINHNFTQICCVTYYLVDVAGNVRLAENGFLKTSFHSQQCLVFYWQKHFQKVKRESRWNSEWPSYLVSHRRVNHQIGDGEKERESNKDYSIG